MSETLQGFFEPLKDLSYDVYVFIISMVPLIELRGAIPVGVALKMDPIRVFLLSVIGSMVPAVFLILLFEKILSFMEKKGIFKSLTKWLNIKFTEKSKKIGNAKFWGILAFTAMPLPGTGVWSASAIASIIKMDFKKAFVSIALGDIVAGILVLGISHLIF